MVSVTRRPSSSGKTNTGVKGKTVHLQKKSAGQHVLGLVTHVRIFSVFYVFAKNFFSFILFHLCRAKTIPGWFLHGSFWHITPDDFSWVRQSCNGKYTTEMNFNPNVHYILSTMKTEWHTSFPCWCSRQRSALGRLMWGD